VVDFHLHSGTAQKRIDDEEIEESFNEFEPILQEFDLVTSHYKSKKSHQRSRCGVSV